MPVIDDNPHFDALRSERKSQHGVTMAYIKTRVGEGVEYSNEIARAVLSENGGYYELHEMPEEFAGALGAGITHRLVPVSEVRQMLTALQDFTDALAQGASECRLLSLYLLYAGGSLRARRGVYVCDHREDAPPFVYGDWQADTLPRFFKLRIDSDSDTSALSSLGLTRGTLFVLMPTQTDDGRCLLVTIPRVPQTVDLGLVSLSRFMN